MVRLGIAALATGLALAACDSGPSEPRVPPDRVAQVVGAAGGTMRSEDGQLTLTIPAGALSEERTITIDPVKPGDVGAPFAGLTVARAYELGPSGQAFAEPVAVALRTGVTAVPVNGALSIPLHLLLTTEGGSLRAVDGTVSRLSGDSVLVEGRLSHFSPLVQSVPVARLEIRELPTDLAFGVPHTIEASLSLEPAAPAALRTATPRLRGLSHAPDAEAPAVDPTPMTLLADGSFSASIELTCAEPEVVVTALDVMYGPGTAYRPAASARVRLPCRSQRLSVVKTGTGSGTVLEATDLLHCGTECTVRLAPGGTVDLLADPDPGSIFVGWTGGCSGTAPAVTVTLNTDVVCTAEFSARRPNLVVVTTGSGSGTVRSFPNGIDCGSTCGAAFDAQTVVDLGATPATGSAFVGWGGDCSGTTATATVTMAADRTCTATFELLTPPQVGLHFLGSLGRPFRIEGAALPRTGDGAAYATKLVTVGFDGDAELNLIDFSDPAAPRIEGTIPNFCPGARSAFFTTPPFGGGPFFIAPNVNLRRGCTNGIPLGMSSIVNFGFAAADGAWLPGTNRYAVTNFEGSEVQLRGPSGPPVQIPLSGAARSCPFSIRATASHIFVVGREGVAGTSTESCNDWRKLFIVDRATNSVARTVDLGVKPRELALSPDGGTVYVTDFDEDRIYEVNVAAGTVARTIPVGDGPVGVAATGDGAHLLVTNWNTNKLQLLSRTSGAVLAETDTRGANPVRVLSAADGRTLVVVNFGGASGGSVSFFRLQTP